MGTLDFLKQAEKNCAPAALVLLTLSLFSACGGHKPAGASPFPAKVFLTPGVSVSLQAGSFQVFTASAQNSSSAAIAPAFTYNSSNSAVATITPSGVVCAGSWNQYFNVCSAGNVSGTSQITATALGVTSTPTTVFVHPPIDNIQISVVPPVNPPPPACPGQTALPAACQIPFNQDAAQHCVSHNQVQTLQATAFSKGTDISATVGPVTWSQDNLSVVTITPVVSTSSNLPQNQVTLVSNSPGLTPVVASVSGVSSQPYLAETCPVQCIALDTGANGSQDTGTTRFVAAKGGAETITATAVDVQGCIVPKPTLTWTSTSPAAIAPGSATTGCGTASTCTIATTQPGGATITAACIPPSCNVGYPLVADPIKPIYTPQPVYPVSSVSGLVTGAAVATTVLVTSQDCYSSSTCGVALYNVASSSTQPGAPTAIPTPPNSLMIDPAGVRAYIGSQYGAQVVALGSIGSSSSAFSALAAPGTPLGRVTGKVIGVSPSGLLAVFSDTVSTPNQVYVVNNTATSAGPVALNINSATVATFSPDSSRAFILGDGGNTLYVYSTTHALQTYPLSAPAGPIAFSSNGAFAFITGGDPAANVTVRNVCDNSLATTTPPGGGNFSITGLPANPFFLKAIPAGNVSAGPIIPALNQNNVALNTFYGLDVFYGVDHTGIDVFATAATAPLSLPVTSSLCPAQTLGLATEAANPGTAFAPVHINLGKGTFTPINFFTSPDASQVYIVTKELGILTYNFSTQNSGSIPLLNGAAPVAADISADGTLLYVAGTDGLLHQILTIIGIDQGPPVNFPQLPNSSNNFCYMNNSCLLNLVAVRP